MIKFEYESHESTNEDQYIKEIVTLKFTVDDGKSVEYFFMPYFKKSGKDGQIYWDVASLGITKFGQKKYDDKFIWDSRNREKQIKNYLENRLWEKEKSAHQTQQQPNANGAYYPHGMAQNTQPAPTSMSEVAANDNLPF